MNRVTGLVFICVIDCSCEGFSSKAQPMMLPTTLAHGLNSYRAVHNNICPGSTCHCKLISNLNVRISPTDIYHTKYVCRSEGCKPLKYSIKPFRNLD